MENTSNHPTPDHPEPETTMSIKFPTNREGYFSQLCPAPACHRAFKIHESAPSVDVMHCPYCGHVAEDFHTPEQRPYGEAVLARAMNQAMKGVEGWTSDPVRDVPPPTEPEDTMPVTALACCSQNIKHDEHATVAWCPFCGTAQAHGA